MDSELTSVEMFVRMFDECETPGQIFNLIDQNRDRFVSLEEIKSKVTEILLNKNNQNIDSSQHSQNEL